MGQYEGGVMGSGRKCWPICGSGDREWERCGAKCGSSDGEWEEVWGHTWEWKGVRGHMWER